MGLFRAGNSVVISIGLVHDLTRVRYCSRVTSGGRVGWKERGLGGRDRGFELHLESLLAATLLSSEHLE